jgi:hypothetical protein
MSAIRSPMRSASSRSCVMKILHLLANERVERAERFVHEQDIGIVRQAAGQSHALLHPSAQLVRALLLPASEADELQRLHRLLPPLLLGYALDLQAVFRIFQHRAVGKQGELLEHHADRLAPNLAKLLRVELNDVRPVDEHLPGRRLDQTVKQPNERRLAAAGQPHNDENFAALDREAHPVNPDGELRLFGDSILGPALIEQPNRPFRIAAEHFR